MLLLAGSISTDHTVESILSGVQLCAPSMDLNAPSPSVPAYRTLRLLGSIANENTAGVPKPVDAGKKVWPPSKDFITPPLGERPAYRVLGALGSMTKLTPAPAIGSQVAPPSTVLYILNAAEAYTTSEFCGSMAIAAMVLSSNPLLTATNEAPSSILLRMPPPLLPIYIVWLAGSETMAASTAGGLGPTERHSISALPPAKAANGRANPSNCPH